jgi:hypothetical protein
MKGVYDEGINVSLDLVKIISIILIILQKLEIAINEHVIN